VPRIVSALSIGDSAFGGLERRIAAFRPCRVSTSNDTTTTAGAPASRISRRSRLGDARRAASSDSGARRTSRAGMTQRYMHLSPAALDSAIRLLDQPLAAQSFGDILETGRRTKPAASRRARFPRPRTESYSGTEVDLLEANHPARAVLHVPQESVTQTVSVCPSWSCRVFFRPLFGTRRLCPISHRPS
jgi:hypothetical protein